jgi:dCMP deaminase
MMINARIRRVVYRNQYPDEGALRFLEQAGIEVVRI